MGNIENGKRPYIHDLDYDIDHEGMLIYWDIIEGKHPLIYPAQPIKDPNMLIGKVGQQNILPNHLSFKKNDLCQTQVTDEKGNPIGETVPPGISGFLFFREPSSKTDEKDFTYAKLGKEMHKKSRIHVARVGDIQEAGWEVYYTPLINKKFTRQHPLHVLMVPPSMTENVFSADATQIEKEALAKVFIRW